MTAKAMALEDALEEEANETSLPSKTVERQLEQMFASRWFRRSQRMRRFLSFLVRHALANSTPPSAQQIAQNVFDRPDLDSRTDPIVRVEARRLRRILMEYYRNEGTGDPVIISLPPPGYQVRFRRNLPSAGLRPSGPVRAGAARSIAVLPFLNMTNDPNQEAFCQGVTEELINALSRMGELKVAARTSTFQYQDPCDIRDIGRELGVSAVLEGSVRLADDRIRITAQLSSSADGFHLWSERFDASFEQGFGLQERLAKRIAAMAGGRMMSLS